MIKMRSKYLLSKKISFLILHNFLFAFGFFWLIIECPSALHSEFQKMISKYDPWILVIIVLLSLLYAVYKTFPRITYTKKFKSTQTSISLKVGDLLDEKENIVIGSSNYFDFNNNRKTGVSLKSQLISRLFNDDIDFINNLVQKSLIGLENIAVFDKEKKYGNKTHYPIGTVAVLPDSGRKIFAVISTKLINIGNKTHTQSDPEILNQSLIGLWKQIKLEGSKKRFSLPVLGAGLGNVNLSYLLIIQSIILSYAIYSKSSTISKEMTLVISPNDYNPEDFEEAMQFLNSIQI